MQTFLSILLLTGLLPAQEGGSKPTFSKELFCPVKAPTASPYFRITSYDTSSFLHAPSAIYEGLKVGEATWRRVRKDDPEVTRDEQGYLQTKNGWGGLYLEWQEPKARKVLVYTYAKDLEINGKSETGDFYGWGQEQWIPVQLRKGTNSYSTFGAAIFQIHTPKSAAFVNPDTVTIPDAKEGEKGLFLGSVVVMNISDKTQPMWLTAQVDGGPVTQTQTSPIPAMDGRIVPFQFQVDPKIKPGIHKLRLWVHKNDVVVLDFKVAKPGDSYRQTYVSRFDGMVRGYSVRDSLTSKADQPIVMFTYGGGRSGVGIDQFKSKDWCHIVSPNYRTFNWDGLARRDALETLDVASKRLKADRTRMYLLGHSMGGHGAYQIASLNPRAFAGIGSSAGWLTVFKYISDLYSELQSTDPVAKIFRGALDECDLEKRLDQLASVKNISIAHGDKDQSVPIAESFRILNEMEKRGTSVQFHTVRGAEHGWNLPGEGNHYDVPFLFEAFRTSPHRGNGNLWNNAKTLPFWADAMGRKIVAIYGTQGSKAETRLAMERAKKEVVIARSIFWVDCEVVPDTIPLKAIKGRNVILFGTPSSNAYWKHYPTAEKLLARARQKQTSFTSWLIQAKQGDQVWSAVGGKDEAGCRLAYDLDPTNNYRRFPQWVLFDSRVATLGIKGVAAAGFSGGPEAWGSNRRLNSVSSVFIFFNTEGTEGVRRYCREKQPFDIAVQALLLLALGLFLPEIRHCQADSLGA